VVPVGSDGILAMWGHYQQKRPEWSFARPWLPGDAESMGNGALLHCWRCLAVEYL
jgi:hypothetical protein